MSEQQARRPLGWSVEGEDVRLLEKQAGDFYGRLRTLAFIQVHWGTWDI